MSKAITGASLLAGALVVGAIAFEVASGGTASVAVLAALSHTSEALALGGASMLAGAVASALTNNRGMGLTTRQAASNRQIIYGIQRVGGIEIYRSTTGSHRDQFNYVIAIAGHECYAIESLYLDGRKVFFDTGSFGYTVRNGIGFGGSADGATRTGPGGPQYNFGGKVFCEARYGDQLAGDVMGSLTANDPQWAASAAGTPYCGGNTYVYLKVEYDTTLFPGEPEIQFTVHGKNDIYDPRTGTRGYSHNWALIVNDILAAPGPFGMGDDRASTAQLIAAANVCDEQVTLAAGGTESRYTCHHHYDTGVSPGDALASVLPAAAGRLSDIGGEYYIWPAYWQAPSFSFGPEIHTKEIQWTPDRGVQNLFNRVTGTYTAANYPYSVSGNLYDSNGFFDGTMANTFPFGFQPTNFPEYAADQLHGYAADEWLNEDSNVSASWMSGSTYAAGTVVSYTQVVAGLPFSSVWKSLVDGNIGNTPGVDPAFWANAANPLPHEISLQTTLSIGQAQRVAKIMLLRNRQQGTGVFEMGLRACQMQPCDVMLLTFDTHGWENKTLEVTGCSPFQIVAGGGDEPPSVRATFSVQETEASVYAWSTTEELSVYALPLSPSQADRDPAPPTNLSLLANPATALIAPDGTITPRIEVLWDTPMDAYVTLIEIQYQIAGALAWVEAGFVDVALNFGFIGPTIAGQAYNVRIRSVRPSGAKSVWVSTSIATDILLSANVGGGVGIGSLVGEAYPDGSAGILCMPFTAYIATLALPIFPSGAKNIPGLLQQRLYYVYYIDLTNLGGDVTPIATLNRSDFLGKPGYYFIDSVTTPYEAIGGGGGMLYYPTIYNDLGSRTSAAPAQMYDGDVTTAGFVTGGSTLTSAAVGDLIVHGFPAITTGAAATLTVVAAIVLSASTPPATPAVASIVATISGVPTTLISLTAPTGLTSTATGIVTYTCPVPSGTNLSSVSVEAKATSFPNGESATVVGVDSDLYVEIFEIYITT